MKARRDFLDEAEYADYLKTYTTIAAMQGVLSNAKLIENVAQAAKYKGLLSDDAKEITAALAHFSVSMSNAVIAELYK